MDQEMDSAVRINIARREFREGALIFTTVMKFTSDFYRHGLNVCPKKKAQYSFVGMRIK